MKKLRANARAKIANGEPLTEDEREALARVDPAFASTGRPADNFERRTASLDPTGKKTGLSDGQMAAAGAFVHQHPEVQALLEQRLVEEPPNASFSHRAVQLLAQAGTPDTEIARLVGKTVDDLKAEALEALELGNTQHRVLLRVAQYRAAMVGDRSLLIWLGKQSLGQVDKAVNEISGRDGKPIEIQDAANDVRSKISRMIAELQSGGALPSQEVASLPAPNAGAA